MTSLPDHAGHIAPELPAAYRPPGSAIRGIFVAVEGISGSGKSTLARLLASQLGAGEPIHVIPAPMTPLTGYVNAACAALPQLLFYLSGVVHAADLVRDRLRTGPCVTDRYVNSVIANHAAVNDIDLSDVFAVVEPLTGSLPRPDLTVYLHTDAVELRRRLRAKPDRTPSDEQLLDSADLTTRVQHHYAVLAASDPSAMHLATDNRSPADLAAQVLAVLRARHAA